MSWLTRSIANSLKLDNENLEEDLSELTETLTHQYRCVSSFLAPNERSEPSDLEPEPIAGIRRDFAEIGGRFRSGISKFASEFLQVDSDDDDCDSSDGGGDSDGDSGGAVGVTDDVVVFVSDIVMHPETWLEFPLPEDEDDDEDFDLSDAQQEHVFAVQRLAPTLRALRIELCPSYMSETSFWKIYFVLLHPRLERDAADLLSTPNIVKARALLTHKLKNRSCSENVSDCKSRSLSLEASAIETVKHPVKSDDVQIVDKSVIQEETHEVKDEDVWLKEESPEIVAILIENKEDVSFSDLEDDDDDDGNIPIHYKNATYASDCSTKSLRDSVQLNRSSIDRKDSDSSAQVSVHDSQMKGSNDWLDVDIDVA
ncbi:putative BSD domain-containing protein [Helianthus annuus]|nr:putative BSD domain-containing protein [Helianthus annuus]